MSERNAILLVFAAAVLLETGIILGLTDLHANESAIGFGGVLPVIGGGYAVSRVVMHYSDSESRR
jgi:hypothetical protein